MSAVTVRLVEIVAPTPRSRLLTLDLGTQPFRFAAGQAVTIAAHGEGDGKPYSIASSPERVATTRQLELLIALDSSGGPELEWAERGAMVDVDGPMGTFTLPDVIAPRRLLFVAGGAGIAPLRSMIDHVLWQDPTQKVALLYSARRADEFAFIDELRAYANAGRLELQQTVTRDDRSWHGRRGRIGPAEFEAVVHEPQRTLCYVCGPPAMVEEAVAVLTALHVPATSIRTEQWGK